MPCGQAIGNQIIEARGTLMARGFPRAPSVTSEGSEAGLGERRALVSGTRSGTDCHQVVYL
jgi:hypothetical protein